METEFNLSEKIINASETETIDARIYGEIIPTRDVKEFIKRLLTPNNLSKGFVEISTIKYYAGEKLI